MRTAAVLDKATVGIHKTYKDNWLTETPTAQLTPDLPRHA